MVLVQMAEAGEAEKARTLVKRLVRVKKLKEDGDYVPEPHPNQEYYKNKVWYPLMKSAMQKYVRRGEVKKAIAATRAALAASKTGPIDRLTIIVAEDSVSALSVVPFIRKKPLWAAAMMSSVPRNKDTCGIIHRFRSARASERRLGVYLDKGDVLKASASAWKIWDEKQDLVQLRDALVHDDVSKALFTRFKKGAFWQTDLQVLLAAMVMWYCELIPKVLPSLEVPEVPAMRRLEDWYVADSHTAPGKHTCATLAKQRGLDKKRLAVAWFRYESSELRLHADHDWYNLRKEIRLTDENPDELWALWSANRRAVAKNVIKSCWYKNVPVSAEAAHLAERYYGS